MTIAQLIQAIAEVAALGYIDDDEANDIVTLLMYERMTPEQRAQWVNDQVKEAEVS